MRLQFIRHGMTAGNMEKRYIGRTDEPLCGEGEAQLREGMKTQSYEQTELLFTSPMLRCRQTCAILFPTVQAQVVENLRETDFGIFEEKNYHDLDGNADYQAWLDSNCTAAMPQGESREQFRQRCCDAFEELLRQNREAQSVTLVVHGGVIMAVLEQYAEPKQDFYAYHIANGAAQSYEWDGTFPICLRKSRKENQESDV